MCNPASGAIVGGNASLNKYLLCWPVRSLKHLHGQLVLQ